VGQEDALEHGFGRAVWKDTLDGAGERHTALETGPDPGRVERAVRRRREADDAVNPVATGSKEPSAARRTTFGASAGHSSLRRAM
jgi:hypothetical protein